MARKSKHHKGAGGVKLVLLTTSLAATLGLWNYFSRQDKLASLENDSPVTLSTLEPSDSADSYSSAGMGDNEHQPLMTATDQPLVTDPTPELVDDKNLGNVGATRTKSSK